MSKFDIKKAKSGEAVVTKNGKPVKILVYDRDSKKFPLVVLLENKHVKYYTIDGKFYFDRNDELDLKMK